MLMQHLEQYLVYIIYLFIILFFILKKGSSCTDFKKIFISWPTPFKEKPPLLLLEWTPAPKTTSTYTGRASSCHFQRRKTKRK
jgi:hypothetical protein